MDILFERYADLIIHSALKLRRGDVLSINTEEENIGFAHLVARKARSITGNGSYIQNLENGKVEITEEASTDNPIEKKPTAFLYLPVYRPFNAVEDRAYSAPELQAFRLLSDPLHSDVPLIPYVSAPLPSDEWGRALDEEGNAGLSASLLSDFLELAEDDYLEASIENESVIQYQLEKLNSMKLGKARLTSEEGTDLEFSFLEGSMFSSSLMKTKSGRVFKPNISSPDIFRAIDPKSANGYITITKPVMLFGKAIRYLSMRFEEGRIVDFQADEEAGKLFSIFLKQDNAAAFASELSITEEIAGITNIGYFAIPQWDRIKSTSITIGGCRPESLAGQDAVEKANDSLVTLSLPIGSDYLTLTALDSNGNEISIMEDGIIREE